MFDAKSVSRALLLTTVVAVAAAPAASAREADAPIHQTSVAAVATSVPPRVDGIGQPPSDVSRVASTPASVPARVDGIGRPPSDHSAPVASPIVQAPSDDGFDWTLAAIGAAAFLSLVLLGAAGWKVRSTRLAHR